MSRLFRRFRRIDRWLDRVAIVFAACALVSATACQR
jgi:hypothetical protein